MPLSEEEQRILRQIEEQLQADPAFAMKVNQRSHHGVSRGRLGWSIVALVVSLAVVIAALQISAWLSFAAFVAMVVAGVFLERELSARGRDQLSRIPDELRRRAGRSSGNSDHN
jgi:ABC-type dipeptide/oligopeptide/nickel transport system permease component